MDRHSDGTMSHDAAGLWFSNLDQSRSSCCARLSDATTRLSLPACSLATCRQRSNALDTAAVTAVPSSLAQIKCRPAPPANGSGALSRSTSLKRDRAATWPGHVMALHKERASRFCCSSHPAACGSPTAMSDTAASDSTPLARSPAHAMAAFLLPSPLFALPMARSLSVYDDSESDIDSPAVAPASASAPAHSLSLCAPSVLSLLDNDGDDDDGGSEEHNQLSGFGSLGGGLASLQSMAVSGRTASSLLREDDFQRACKLLEPAASCLGTTPLPYTPKLQTYNLRGPNLHRRAKTASVVFDAVVTVVPYELGEPVTAVREVARHTAPLASGDGKRRSFDDLL